MANYADGRWAAFQYKVSEMMQLPEFKFKPSPALMKYVKNTDFLIPASEKERVMGVKESDQDTVEINFINKQTIATGSERAYNHTGSINDSTKVTAAFTTYAADFTYSIKGADRTIWQLADQVAKQIRSAAIALHASIETALLARMNTYKSQVVTSATPKSGTWDATNFILGIANGDANLWMQKVKGFMREQYYRGMPFDAVVDEYLYQLGEHLIQQGQGNSTNLGWQAQGLMADVTEELTTDAGYLGMGYIFPQGTIGILPWIPKLNRQNYGDPGKVGGLYTTIPDPLGSGLTFAVHEYYTGADNQNGAGETQDINVHVELSIDLAPVEDVMSTAKASPIFKFGLLQ
jgi:hypothetical protein